MIKSKNYDQKIMKIEEKYNAESLKKKIELILNLDNHWKNKNLNFRTIYHLGKIGMEVNIKDKSFITDEVLKVLQSHKLELGTIGFFSSELMVTIWENEKK